LSACLPLYFFSVNTKSSKGIKIRRIRLNKHKNTIDAGFYTKKQLTIGKKQV
jgi:hypothetical protein